VALCTTSYRYIGVQVRSLYNIPRSQIVELTRQLLRAEARLQAKHYIDTNWPGEPRRKRREIAHARARLSWRQLIPRAVPYVPASPEAAPTKVHESKSVLVLPGSKEWMLEQAKLIDKGIK
jgi:hypothetical protein